MSHIEKVELNRWMKDLPLVKRQILISFSIRNLAHSIHIKITKLPKNSLIKTVEIIQKVNNAQEKEIASKLRLVGVIAILGINQGRGR